MHPAVHLLLHHRHEVVVVADLVEERVTVSGQHLRTEEVLYLRLVELQGAAAVLLLSEVLQDGGFRLSQHRYLFLWQVFRDAVEQDVAVRHLQPSRLIPVDAVHGLCLAGVYVALPCGEGMHGGRLEGDVDDLVFFHQCRHPFAKPVRFLGEVGSSRGRSLAPFLSRREGVAVGRGGDGLGLLLRVFYEGLRRMPCKHLLLGFGELGEREDLRCHVLVVAMQHEGATLVKTDLVAPWQRDAVGLVFLHESGQRLGVVDGQVSLEGRESVR